MSDEECRESWRTMVENKLDMLMRLEDGWGYGERAVSEAARAYFQSVLDLAPDEYMRMLEPCAHNGGIHLEWDVGPDAFTAAIDHDGTLWLFTLPEDELEDREEEISNPAPTDLLDFVIRTTKGKPVV